MSWYLFRLFFLSSGIFQNWIHFFFPTHEQEIQIWNYCSQHMYPFFFILSVWTGSNLECWHIVCLQKILKIDRSIIKSNSTPGHSHSHSSQMRHPVHTICIAKIPKLIYQSTCSKISTWNRNLIFKWTCFFHHESTV